MRRGHRTGGAAHPEALIGALKRMMELRLNWAHCSSGAAQKRGEEPRHSGILRHLPPR